MNGASGSGVLRKLQQILMRGSRPGLRRKFFLTVVLPPLVPFLVLGYFGYAQLSSLVGSVVLGQLSRSASATATRVEREFAIRETVLTQTGKDVFAIRREYGDQRTQLDNERAGCVVAALKGSQNAIKSSDCKPFLAGFATIPDKQFNSGNETNVLDQLIQAGYDEQVATSQETEAAKINDRLTTFRTFFPETEPMAVIEDARTVVAKLDSSKYTLPGFLETGPGLKQRMLTSKRSVNGQLFLIASYPIDSQGDAIMAAYDVSSPKFLANISDSGPHLDRNDQLLVADQDGNLVYPAMNLDSHSQIQGILRTSAASKGDDNQVYRYINPGNMGMEAKAAVVPGMGWVVLAAAPEAVIGQKLKTTQTSAMLAILGAVAVSMLVGLIFVTAATRAIKRLGDGAQAFAGRNFDKLIEVKTGDELEALAGTMNDMAAQIQAAEKALDEKNKEFINVATHELKAPMTAIIGYLSMVIEDGEGKVDDVARDMITQAYASTKRLRDLVSELLDIARLEAGKAQFEIKPLSVVDEATMAVNNLRITAKDKHITINYEPPKDLPQVKADQTKVGIIITNFISNAIKYNRENGTVTVAHSLADGFVTTSVADTGLGIPEAQKDKMFQKFFRVETQNRAGIPGTGLGLHITKQFIEAMGGKVWFESEEGKGTTFFFTLPVA